MGIHVGHVRMILLSSSNQYPEETQRITRSTDNNPIMEDIGLSGVVIQCTNHKSEYQNKI